MKWLRAIWIMLTCKRLVFRFGHPLEPDKRLTLVFYVKRGREFEQDYYLEPFTSRGFTLEE